MLGDLEGVEAERAEDLAEDQHAGDDRRGPVGMQARDVAPLALGEGGETGE